MFEALPEVIVVWMPKKRECRRSLTHNLFLMFFQAPKVKLHWEVKKREKREHSLLSFAPEIWRWWWWLAAGQVNSSNPPDLGSGSVAPAGMFGRFFFFWCTLHFCSFISRGGTHGPAMWMKCIYLFIYSSPTPHQIYSQIAPDEIALALAATFHRLMDFAWAVSVPWRAEARLSPLTNAQEKKSTFKCNIVYNQAGY